MEYWKTFGQYEKNTFSGFQKMHFEDSIQKKNVNH